MGRFLSPVLAVILTKKNLSNSNSRLIGPAAKLLLHHYRLDATSIKSTGPKNNLLKSDLLLFINERKLVPQPQIIDATAAQVTLKNLNKTVQTKSNSKISSNFVDIPLSNMRSTIVKRLTSSKNSIPHSYQSISIVANELLALRKKFTNNGFKVSVNDFVIKAVSLALRTVPNVNVQWKDERVQIIPSISISVAVATSGGLITPIIFNADQLSVINISKQIRDLAERARENKLKPNEFQGGSFSVSNLGMYGISHFTAIINPPQAAILTVGGARMELNEFDRPEQIFNVTLCFDARAINDSDAQKFLRHLNLLLSNPESMIAGTEHFELETI